MLKKGRKKRRRRRIYRWRQQIKVKSISTVRYLPNMIRIDLGCYCDICTGTPIMRALAMEVTPTD